MPPRRVYWDACTFIGLLNQEPDKVNECTAVWREAERGETIIVTSFLTWAEVYKAKCEVSKPLSEAEDDKIAQLLSQAWIQPAVVDERTGLLARKLLRRHTDKCSKPTDALHLATALLLNVDEMHTFDGSDLLGLDGVLFRDDAQRLRICKPEAIPPAAPKALPLQQELLP